MIGKRLSRTAVAAVVLVAAGSIAVAGLFGGKKDKADPGAGDLAVIDLRVHEIRTDGGVPRVVVQALVENQKAVPRAGAFELIVRVKDAKEALGTCEGDGLPQGQVALDLHRLWAPWTSSCSESWAWSPSSAGTRAWSAVSCPSSGPSAVASSRRRACRGSSTDSACWVRRPRRSAWA